MSHPHGPAWSNQEDLLLEQSYGKIPVKAILAANPALLGRSPHALYQRAVKLGLKSGIRHRLHHTIRLDFFKRPTLEAAYWAGFLAADGSLVQGANRPNTYRLCLAVAVKDEEHLKLFQRTMGHTGKIGYVHHPAGRIGDHDIAASSMCFVNICQAGRFVGDLARLGIIPDKTKRIAPPQLEGNLLKLAYFKGYLDGDGCLSITEHEGGIDRLHLQIVSSSRAILLWSKNLIDQLFPFSYMDRPYSEVNENAASETWQYNITGYRALRIVHLLSRIPTPELARKWQKPRLLEMIEESKVSHPAIWSERLPIEDEIDRHLAPISVELDPLSV